MNDNHLKNLFSQTAVYGIGLLANKAVSFVLLPLYTFYFAPADLGSFNIAQSLWMFAILFYLYGLETAFIKFFIDGKDDVEKKTIYSTTLILLLSSSLVLSLALYFSAGFLTDLIHYENREQGLLLMKIFPLVLFTDALFRFPLLLLRAELKAKQYLLLTLLSLLVNVSLNIILIAFYKFGVEAIFYSYIASVVVTFIAGFWVTQKHFAFTFSKETAKRLAAYGNKFLYIGVFILLIDVSDRFFLKYFFREETVGIYSANYRLASVMALMISAFRFSWTPYFLNLEKNSDNKKIISDIFTYLVFAGFLLFLFFAFFTGPVVKLSFGKFSILDPRYQGGLVIIPVVLLAYLFSGIYSALSVAPFYADKTGELFTVSLLGLVLNAVLNIVLIPLYGMQGAAVSTAATYLFMLVLLYIRMRRIYRIDFEIKKIFTVVILSSVLYFSYRILESVSSGIFLMIFSVLLLAAYIIFSKIFHVINYTTVKTIFTSHT
ncbi:MAG: oligosaccharide flippase family protein [Ignavibacteria bacterium]|jgi:O-antigen/teichoic acid export membrane protein|nr:oligosaccharide flippase family protein [Ignavibacteria bacterium]